MTIHLFSQGLLIYPGEFITINLANTSSQDSQFKARQYLESYLNCSKRHSFHKNDACLMTLISMKFLKMYYIVLASNLLQVRPENEYS